MSNPESKAKRLKDFALGELMTPQAKPAQEAIKFSLKKWVSDQRANIYRGEGDEEEFICGDVPLQEAELFVKAVNNHEALVERLKELIRLRRNRGDDVSYLDQLLSDCEQRMGKEQTENVITKSFDIRYFYNDNDSIISFRPRGLNYSTNWSMGTLYIDLFSLEIGFYKWHWFAAYRLVVSK